MNHDPLLVPTVVFWILTSLIVFLPVRWAAVFYLLLVQVDLSALSTFSISSLGYENAIKVILIPTLLLFRIRKEIELDAVSRKYLGFWALFTAYAALTILWSPYRIPAVKMIGYMYAYGVLLVVFSVGWHRKWFSAGVLMSIVWCSLAGATIQSYFLGNAFGSDEFQWRFTTFAGAQSFAPFLMALSVLLLFQERLSISVFLTVAGAGLGLLLTGSRSAFLGFLWVLLVYGIFSAVRSSKKVRLGAILKKMLLIAAALAVIFAIVIQLLPEDRLNEMVSAAMEKNSSIEDVGTFGWRLSLYLKTIDELSQRNIPQLLVGSGTSSGASLVLDQGFFLEEGVDPNRALHDEFLRATYEWGVLGLFALLFLLGTLLRLALRMIAREGSVQAWAFLAIFAPLLLSLTVENFLADSGSPGGVGYTLVLTCMLAANGFLSGKEPASVEQASLGPAPILSNSARIQPEG